MSKEISFVRPDSRPDEKGIETPFPATTVGPSLFRPDSRPDEKGIETA